MFPNDSPDGEDDHGPYWECPDCSTRYYLHAGETRRGGGAAARNACCFYD